MNINRIFDEYDSEDYLCYRTKPIAQLICSACHNPHEYTCAYEAGGAGDIGYYCCAVCHSMDEPYEEEQMKSIYGTIECSAWSADLDYATYCEMSKKVNPEMSLISESTYKMLCAAFENDFQEWSDKELGQMYVLDALDNPEN